MELLKAIYFVIRTWFDFTVLLPTWYLLIETDKFLTGSCRHVAPYTDDTTDDMMI